ncbi:unnamed protein product, partial [Allacma fusca]
MCALRAAESLYSPRVASPHHLETLPRPVLPRGFV